MGNIVVCVLGMCLVIFSVIFVVGLLVSINFCLVVKGSKLVNNIMEFILVVLVGVF